LIEEGWLRVVEYQDNNVRRSNVDRKRVLFPCDINNKEVERKDLDPRCHQYISNLWAHEIGDN